MMKDDDALGMMWWNHLTERERTHWATLAGTGRAKDAWELFKQTSAEIEEAGDDENPPENLPQVSRASHYS